MTDIVDPETRSRMMAGIRSKDKKPELAVRRALRSYGIGYRLSRKGLGCRPDIVLAKYRTVVFVHGCYWHRHGCRKSTTTSTNRKFWLTKFERNIARDAKIRTNLPSLGWRIATIWECGVNGKDLHSLSCALETFLKCSSEVELVWPHEFVYACKK